MNQFEWAGSFSESKTSNTAQPVQCDTQTNDSNKSGRFQVLFSKSKTFSIA